MKWTLPSLSLDMSIIDVCKEKKHTQKKKKQQQKKKQKKKNQKKNQTTKWQTD